jgi:hypothetical protein
MFCGLLMECAVDSAFRELLSGTNKGAMNLAAVEARALDLRRCLDEMLTGLTRNAHNISWCTAAAHDCIESSIYNLPCVEAWVE